MTERLIILEREALKQEFKQLIGAAEGLLNNYSNLLHFNEQVVGELIEDIIVHRHSGSFDPKEIEETA